MQICMRMNKQEHWEVQEDREHENGIPVINYQGLNDDESENHVRAVLSKDTVQSNMNNKDGCGSLREIDRSA